MTVDPQDVSGTTGREARPGGAEARLDVGAIIDEGPWTPRQKLLLVLVGSAILLDGFDNQSLGLAAPAIMREWGTSKEALAPILAIGQVGMMIGTALGGMLGDRLGRKTALLSSMVLFGVATALMSLANGIDVLGGLRLLAGIGLGGALPNAAALVAEYTPARRRTLAVTTTIVCVPLGGVVGGLAAAALLPTEGWRALFALAGLVPVLLVAVLAFALPESARFLLLTRGDGPLVRRCLDRMGIAVPPHATVVDAATGPATSRGSLGDLLEPAFRRDTLLLWTAFGSCLLAIYAGFSWLPTMLADAGYDLATSSRGLMAFNLGGVFAAVGAAWLIGTRGSRGPMVAMAVGGMAVAALLLFFPAAPGQAAFPILVALAVLGGCVNGVQTTLYALAAHLYPTGVRATGVGAAASVGRIGGILSSVVGAAVLSAFGPSGFYVVMIVAMFVTAVALLALRNHCGPNA